MIREGQIALFRFPYPDRAQGKIRPVLVLCRVPGYYDDWLVCLITSRLEQAIAEFDEVIARDDPDYLESGLKKPSLIRVGRLAVVIGKDRIGGLGQIDNARLLRIKQRVCQWIQGA